MSLELNLKLSKEERNIQQHEMTSSKLQIKSQKLLEVEKELEQLRVFLLCDTRENKFFGS